LQQTQQSNKHRGDNMTKELKKLRTDFDYTQSDLAKLLGFKQTSSYSRKENGEIAFSIEEVKKIKKIFRLSIEDVVKIFLN
jgi:DNA-binding XRE family transcriptional regulator